MTPARSFPGVVGVGSRLRSADGGVLRIAGDFDPLRGGWPVLTEPDGERRRITDDRLRQRYWPLEEGASFRIETSYPWHPNVHESERDLDAETVEDAAQVFASEAEVPTSYTLAEIVEDLATEGKVEYQDPETGRTVVVRRVGVEVAA